MGDEACFCKFLGLSNFVWNGFSCKKFHRILRNIIFPKFFNDYFWWFVKVCRIYYCWCLLFCSFQTENQMVKVPTSQVSNFSKYLLFILFNFKYFFMLLLRMKLRQRLKKTCGKNYQLDLFRMLSFLIDLSISCLA